VGSLSPTFVPARPVRLAVKLPSAFALYRVMSIHPEGTLGRLRYPLGGDRPSQTTRLALSACRLTASHETQNRTRVVFHCCLPHPHKGEFAGSHLSYARTASSQGQVVVKLHGVFLSCRGEPVSSRVLQFRRAPCRDSAQVVTPFVRVGTYPTRNFATLGPL
jgi:hypothetical protein